MKRTLSLSLSLLSAMTGAQAIGGGQDGNAWNPANWQITYERQGLDEFSRIELSPTDQKYYSHTYRRDWQTGVWTRDGVLYFGEPIVLPVSHEGGKPDAIQMTSDGTITVHVNWISPLYPAPSKMLLKLESGSAGLASGENKTVQVRNGLGHRMYGPDAMEWWASTGTGYRQVEITGTSGSVEISKSAIARSDGPRSRVATVSNGLLAEVAEIAVAFPEYSKPNSNVIPLGPLFPQFYIQNEDPTNLELHFAVQKLPFQIMQYKYEYVTPILHPIFLGHWSDDKTVRVSDPYLYPTNWASLARILFSEADVLRMIGGDVFYQTLQISATDNTTFETTLGHLTLNIHSPVSVFKIGPKTDKWSDPIPVGPWTRLDPHETVDMTVQHGHVESVTAGVDFSTSVNLDLGFLDLFKISIGADDAVRRGETASISVLTSTEFHVTNEESVLRRVRLVKRAKHLERQIITFLWGSNGYMGWDLVKEISFASGTKELAEIGDFEIFREWEMVTE